MILSTIFSSFQGKIYLGIVTLSTMFAISEIILGQIIASIPPTLAVIISLVVLTRKQDRIAEAVDGKLSQLMTAEKGVSKAEGVAEERADAHAIKKEEAIAKAADAVATAVLPGSSVDNPVHTRTSNTPEDPVNVKPVKE